MSVTSTGILFVFLLYFCGSIPFSYFVPKKLSGVDIRTVGSGNIGATNVIRALGKKIGVLCLILDALKVFIPLLILKFIVFSNGSQFEQQLWFSAAAVAGVLGHDYSIFMRFKGGKGVSSSMGVFFAVNWISGSIFLGLGLLLAFTTKIMSVTSFTALTVSTVLIYFLTDSWVYLCLYIFLSLFSLFRHRKNILRLLKKEEKKFM